MPESSSIVRTALVTGGSRGIGRAICLELAKAGCNVAVNYAGSAAAAEETAAQCRALGVRAEAFQADVSSAAACAALVEQVLAAFGSTIIPYAIAAKAMANQMVTDGRQDIILAASVKATNLFAE